MDLNATGLYRNERGRAETFLEASHLVWEQEFPPQLERTLDQWLSVVTRPIRWAYHSHGNSPFVSHTSRVIPLLTGLP